MGRASMAIGSRASVNKFAGNEDGTIAVIFALTAFVLISVIGVAIDYGRAASVRTKLQRAADAAVMGSIGELGKTDAEMRDQVTARLHANLPPALQKIPFELLVEDEGRQMTINMETKVKTSLMALAGFDEMPVVIQSKVTMARPKAPPSRGGAPDYNAPQIALPQGGSGPAQIDAGKIDLSQLQKLGANIDRAQAERMIREIERQLREAQSRGQLDGLNLPPGLFNR